MSSKLFKTYLPVGLLMLLVSCGNWGWESIETDNMEQLNVFGLISLDDSLESFIIVHKTLDTAGPDEINVGQDTIYFEAWEWFDETSGTTVRDTFWYDPPYIRTQYESSYLVKDAEVIISDGVQDYLFERATPEGSYNPYDSYYGDIYQDPAIYRNLDLSFVPQPNTSYSLSISTPDGMEMTGSVTTPPRPVIKEALLPDTVSIKNLFNVAWQSQGNYTASVATDYASDEIYDWICGLEQWSELEAGDSTWNSTYPSWCFEQGWEINEDAVNLMKIRVRFMDENYYQYFLGIDETATISNLLLGEGGIASGYGIEGGFGVFGSISADWTHRIATQ